MFCLCFTTINLYKRKRDRRIKKKLFKMSADSDIENFSENDDYDYDYPGK